VYHRPIPFAVDKYGLYDQLVDLPETLTGELLNGQLHAHHTPAPKHLHATARLDRAIGRGCGDGDDGPGGWWILIEPEIRFVRDIEVAVPDLAGWERERMALLTETAYFEIAPDWVREILSPPTASIVIDVGWVNVWDRKAEAALTCT